jgi:hypothetical protein
MLAILLIPAALCYTFGEMVGDRRQGWAVLAAMFVIFVPLLLLGYWAEQSGNPRLAALGADQAAGDAQPGGNMEGKEVRFGIAQSAIWAAATTAASNGSVNSMHDSYTPLGGLVPMWLIQLGEVVFGGVGSGLYGMLVFAIIPAAFASTYPVLDNLNIMRLATPTSAILSAVIFNALIIVALIPLALRGVKYRPIGAAALLRNNLLVFGLGGLVAPFPGIKLIDMLLAFLGVA